MNQKIKDNIYSFVDKITWGKGIPRIINGFTIRFPPKWSRYFQSDYEKENVVFIKKNLKPGAVAIDIGAHLGLMSSIMGKLGSSTGRVYSFEPTPQTFIVLQKVILLNGLSSVVLCINQALSSLKGEMDFYVDEYEGSNANSLVARVDRQRKSVKVQTTTLDDFVTENNFTRLDLIKVDAEGAEYQVLQGAKETLLRYKPAITLAIHPSLIDNTKTIASIYDLLLELNYSIRWKNSVLDKSAFCSKSDFFDVHLTAQ